MLISEFLKSKGLDPNEIFKTPIEDKDGNTITTVYHLLADYGQLKFEEGINKCSQIHNS